MQTSSRWMHAISLLTSVAALVIGLLPTSVPHEIMLTDPSGRPRIRLVASNVGGRVELIDEAGSTRLAMTQQNRDVTFELASSKDGPALELVVEDTVPVLAMRQGKYRLKLGLSHDFGGGLSVTGPTNGISVSADPVSSGVLGQYLGRVFRIDAGTNQAGFAISQGNSFIQLLQTSDEALLQLTSPPDIAPRVKIRANRLGGAVVVDGPKPKQ
jgi:hypothetical protein